MKFNLLLIPLILFLLASCNVEDNREFSENSTKGHALINQKIRHEKFVAQIYDIKNNKVVCEIPIESSGNFNIPKISDGVYSINAVSTSGIPYKSSSLNFSVEDQIPKQDIKLIITDRIEEELIITGIVDFPKDVNYIDVKVLLCKEKDGKPIRTFTVDMIGIFKMKNVKDGTYYIVAEGPGGITSEWMEIIVVNGKVQADGEILLKLER